MSFNSKDAIVGEEQREHILTAKHQAGEVNSRLKANGSMKNYLNEWLSLQFSQQSIRIRHEQTTLAVPV